MAEEPPVFGSESSLFTSYYQTETKNWIKPSDYIKEIKELNLEGDGDGLEIKLSDNLTKNLEKVEKLYGIMEKWIAILRRALFYTESQKTNSDVPIFLNTETGRRAKILEGTIEKVRFSRVWV